MTKKPKTENWEEEFDKKFVRKDEQTKGYRDDWFIKDYITARHIKSFIQSLLNSERQKLVEEILEKIDKDYKGRDITIYELGDWIKKLK